jgi:predicted MPP superfamily phosphohydrolase
MGKQRLKQTEYEIFSKKLPAAFDGYRIVQLSDLHGARYGDKQEELLRVISQARPDVIFMTGDMADNTKGAVEAGLELCRGLASYEVYYVLGNHELTLKAPVLEPYLVQVRAAGVHVMRNEAVLLHRGGSSICLYGLETPIVYYKNPFAEYKRDAYFSVEDTGRLLGNVERKAFSILLAHDPLYYPSYREWGADLTLSGHIHGGVINLPGLGGVLSPDRSLFPKYDAGHFEEEGKQLIVSRGLGNHFLIRVNNPAEVVTVVLRSGR